MFMFFIFHNIIGHDLTLFRSETCMPVSALLHEFYFTAKSRGGGSAGFKLEHSRVSWGVGEKEKKFRSGGASYRYNAITQLGHFRYI